MNNQRAGDGPDASSGSGLSREKTMMTGTKKTTLMADGGSGTGPRVVHKGNDGIWLNCNPQRRGGVKGGCMQHMRGVTDRAVIQTGR